MKNTRKWLSLVLAAALSLCLAVPALAADTTADPLETAAEFMALLDEAEIEYTDRGIDSDGDYSIDIVYPGDYVEEHLIHLYIDEDGGFFSAYEWYLLTYDETRLDEVLEAVNELNKQYRFVTFHADTSDNTITAKSYGVLRGDAEFSANLLFYAYDWLPIIVDDVWTQLIETVPVVGDEPAVEPVREPVVEPVVIPPEAPAAVSLAGTWYFSALEMEEDGETFTITAEMIGSREFFVLRLTEDGKAEFTNMGDTDTVKGEWTREEDAFKVNLGGEDIDLTLKDANTLQMDIMGEDGFALTLVRDAA